MRIGIVCGDFITEYSNNERELVRGLVELGQDVSIFTSNRKPTRFFERGAEVSAKEENIQSFKVIRRKALFSFKGFHYIPELCEALVDSDVDLIHTVENFPPHSWHAFKASLEKRVPLTFTQHQYYMPDKGLGLLFRIIEKTRSKKINKRSNRIIAVSNAAKRFLIERYKVSEDRIVVVPSGVDTGLFKPQRKEKTDNGLTLMTVARLTEAKGLVYLIRAFQIIRENFPNARLLIVGKGEQTGELKKLVSSLGLDGNVSFLSEYILNEGMPSLYNSCDIFVLPSLIEPVGIAAIEAVSCGLPIIATSVGGLSDVVEENLNGFLVPPRDHVSITTKIYPLLEDGDLRKKFGKASRRIALQKFDYKKVAQRTLKVYEDIMGKS